MQMQRQERFHADYLQNVEALIEAISPHIQHKYKDLPDETRHANLAVAEFIKKCLSLTDRGFAFRLVSIYLRNCFRPDDPRALYEYKFVFLQWICQHEHYVPLNLPKSSNWPALIQKSAGSSGAGKELDAEFKLSESFCRNHYLAGLMLQEVRSALNEVSDVRKIGLRCLRDLMAKHELDDRYQSKGHQNRIASLYLPWISVVLDNWNRLNVFPTDGGTGTSVTTGSVVSSSVASPSIRSGKSSSLPRNMQPNFGTPTNSWKRYRVLQALSIGLFNDATFFSFSL